MAKRRWIISIWAAVLAALLLACGAQDQTAAAMPETWPQETVQTAEPQTQPPETTQAPMLWLDNVLMEDDIGYQDNRTLSTETYASDNLVRMAGKVLGTDILRRQVVKITFLDTLENCPGEAWDVSRDGNGSVMAWVQEVAFAWPEEDMNAADLLEKPAYELYIAGEGGVCSPENCRGLFGGYVFAEEIRFDGNFHTDFAVNMGHMFQDCRSLTRLDLAQMETAGVTGMEYMFSYVPADLDLTGMVTASVTNLECMLNSTDGILTGLETWDTSQVRYMARLFSFNNMETLDLSGWDVSNVEDMYAMFYNSPKLAFIDLSGWNGAKVKDVSEMFFLDEKLLLLDLTGAQFSSVENMYGMFFECKNLGMLDMSGFDTSHVTSMEITFNNCQNMTALNLSGWDTSNVQNMALMFCESPCLPEDLISHFVIHPQANTQNMCMNSNVAMPGSRR